MAMVDVDGSSHLIVNLMIFLNVNQIRFLLWVFESSQTSGLLVS